MAGSIVPVAATACWTVPMLAVTVRVVAAVGAAVAEERFIAQVVVAPTTTSRATTVAMTVPRRLSRPPCPSRAAEEDCCVTGTP